CTFGARYPDGHGERRREGTGCCARPARGAGVGDGGGSGWSSGDGTLRARGQARGGEAPAGAPTRGGSNGRNPGSVRAEAEAKQRQAVEGSEVEDREGPEGLRRVR